MADVVSTGGGLPHVTDKGNQLVLCRYQIMKAKHEERERGEGERGGQRGGEKKGGREGEKERKRERKREG